MTNETEKKTSKAKRSPVWIICTPGERGVLAPWTDASGEVAHYTGKDKAIRAARELAAEHPGNAFRPVSLGPVLRAEEVREVKVSTDWS